MKKKKTNPAVLEKQLRELAQQLSEIARRRADLAATEIKHRKAIAAIDAKIKRLGRTSS